MYRARTDREWWSRTNRRRASAPGFSNQPSSSTHACPPAADHGDRRAVPRRTRATQYSPATTGVSYKRQPRLKMLLDTIQTACVYFLVSEPLSMNECRASY